MIKGGYPGAIYPVNPKGGTILGLDVITDIKDLPEPVDLGIVAVPVNGVQGALEKLGNKGVACATIIAGGYAETGPEGRLLQEDLQKTARQTGIRLIGPNTIGIIAFLDSAKASLHVPPTRE